MPIGQCVRPTGIASSLLFAPALRSVCSRGRGATGSGELLFPTSRHSGIFCARQTQQPSIPLQPLHTVHRIPLPRFVLSLSSLAYLAVPLSGRHKARTQLFRALQNATSVQDRACAARYAEWSFENRRRCAEAFWGQSGARRCLSFMCVWSASKRKQAQGQNADHEQTTTCGVSMRQPILLLHDPTGIRTVTQLTCMQWSRKMSTPSNATG